MTSLCQYFRSTFYYNIGYYKSYVSNFSLLSMKQYPNNTKRGEKIFVYPVGIYGNNPKINIGQVMS